MRLGAVAEDIFEANKGRVTQGNTVHLKVRRKKQKRRWKRNESVRDTLR